MCNQHNISGPIVEFIVKWETLGTNEFDSCLCHSKHGLKWGASSLCHSVQCGLCFVSLYRVGYIEFKDIASFIWLTDKFSNICPATEILFFLLYFWHFISPCSAFGPLRVSLSVFGFSSCRPVSLLSFVWSLVSHTAYGAQQCISTHVSESTERFFCINVNEFSQHLTIHYHTVPSHDSLMVTNDERIIVKT